MQFADEYQVNTSRVCGFGKIKNGTSISLTKILNDSKVSANISLILLAFTDYALWLVPIHNKHLKVPGFSAFDSSSPWLQNWTMAGLLPIQKNATRMLRVGLEHSTRAVQDLHGLDYEATVIGRKTCEENLLGFVEER